MARNVVATTATVMSKAERAMVAEATRTMAETAVTAATMTPNDGKAMKTATAKTTTKR